MHAFGVSVKALTPGGPTWIYSETPMFIILYQALRILPPPREDADCQQSTPFPFVARKYGT
jgi:hypothetical protein